MIHTLLGYWAYTLAAFNLVVAAIAALGTMLILRALGIRAAKSWTPLARMQALLVFWWWLACMHGTNRYDYLHKDQSVALAMFAVLLTLIPGLAVLFGPTTIIDRLRQRRTPRP